MMKINKPQLSRARKNRVRIASYRGFTLVEVLVAVAIVALAVTGILIAMMRQVDGTAYLRDKMFANYVALNQMELALLTNEHSNQLPTQVLSGNDEMAGRKWYWRAQPKALQQPGITQLAITVTDVEDKDAAPIASIDVLLDSYHKLGQ